MSWVWPFYAHMGSSHHRFLLQRCLGSAFIRPVAVDAEELGVYERDSCWLEAAGSNPQLPAFHFLLHGCQHGEHSALDSLNNNPQDSGF